jgi:hypothetical protein
VELAAVVKFWDAFNAATRVPSTSEINE